MSRSNANLPYKLSNYKIIRDREIGFGKCIGDDDDLSRKIYSNLDAYNNELYLSRRPLTYNCDQGGIFNLEFSPDGKLLIAACEGKSVLLFDAFNQRFLNKILNAHLKCVNCVRFLDQNTFATCSDDGTIKTWDLRFMKTSTRTLQGHSNWVKNIEYSEKEKVMVTSGFDGSIYSWNLNNNYELGVSYNKVFMMTGLMRTKLTPDDSKMIISTTTGYMIIVHDLNLSTMCADLKNFQPHLYRLMQMTEETFPAATIFNPLFMSSRNRLEFVDDFPNSAEVISSVQIHPMGWSALSRNISTDNETEWTCVHDIQMKEPKEYDDIYKYVEANDQEDTEEAPLEHLTDIWQGIRTLDQSDEYRRSRGIERRSYIDFINSGLLGRLYQRNYQHWPGEKNRIVKNLPRLTHSIKELSVGKGYIKELCFSSDGRVIGSPYGKGVRLLAFNRDVQEICSCVPKEPQELFVVSKMMDYHSDVVVSCKFNPRHYQMVSGCLGGDIVWYRPIL